MKDRNDDRGAIVATPATVDWAAVEELAKRLGPRTQGLVATRNEAGLRCWLAYAVRASANLPPDVAAAYRGMAGLVSVELRDAA